MRKREDVESQNSPKRPGRRPPPEGSGRRCAIVRETFGSRGRWTTAWMFAGEIGVDGRTYREWEKNGRFPGVKRLVEAYSKLSTMREHGVDPEFVAQWVETGPDGSPPFLLDYGLARTAPAPVNLDDAEDPRSTPVAGELDAVTPNRGTNILAESEARSTARGRLDELSQVIEGKRLRGEKLSDLESQLAALWPRLRQAIEAAEVLFNEADGNRTRNLRIDSLIKYALGLGQVLLPPLEPAPAAA